MLTKFTALEKDSFIFNLTNSELFQSNHVNVTNSEYN